MIDIWQAKRVLIAISAGKPTREIDFNVEGIRKHILGQIRCNTVQQKTFGMPNILVFEKSICIHQRE